MNTQPISIIDAFLKKNKQLSLYLDSVTCVCGRKPIPYLHHESEVQSDGGVSDEFPVGVTCKDCVCGQPGISIYSKKGNAR